MPCGIRPSNVRVCHFTTRAESSLIFSQPAHRRKSSFAAWSSAPAPARPGVRLVLEEVTGEA